MTSSSNPTDSNETSEDIQPSSSEDSEKKLKLSISEKFNMLNKLIIAKDDVGNDLHEEIETDDDKKDFSGEQEFPEITEIQYPKYSLHRNSNYAQDAEEFIPGDLITLYVKGTGDWKISRAIMYDARGQIRYQAASGGIDHDWTTRIQQTKTFGDWKFSVEGPLIIENQDFKHEIPFSIVKFLPEQVELIVEPAIEYISAKIDEIITEIPEIEIPIIEIAGVGPAYAKRFNEADIYYFYQFVKISPIEAAEIAKSTTTKSEGWFTFINGVFKDTNHKLMVKYAPTPTSDGDTEFAPLLDENETPEKIKGIGPATAKKLTSGGYSSIKSIADSSPQQIVDAIKVSNKKAVDWISDAQEKLYGKISLKLDDVSKVEVLFNSDDPSTNIKGIGPATYKKLQAKGFGTIKSVSDAEPEDIASAISVTIHKAKGWIADAQAKRSGKTVKEEPKLKKKEPVKDVLLNISGIGPTYNRRYKEAGITTIESFAVLSVEKIAEIGKIKLPKAKQWKDEAIRLLDK